MQLWKRIRATCEKCIWLVFFFCKLRDQIFCFLKLEEIMWIRILRLNPPTHFLQFPLTQIFLPQVAAFFFHTHEIIQIMGEQLSSFKRQWRRVNLLEVAEHDNAHAHVSERKRASHAGIKWTDLYKCDHWNQHRSHFHLRPGLISSPSHPRRPFLLLRNLRRTFASSSH